MATIQSAGYHEHAGFSLGGSVGEAVCGVGAILLAIVGLANPEWTMLAPIAAIVAGAALVFAGAAATARYPSDVTTDRDEMSAEFLGGVTGLVLGVLAILGIIPGILVSVAVIVFGACLILGSVGSRFIAASGSQVLVGLSTVILGVIALVSEASYGATLNLVALLVVGAGILLTGTALTRRMMHALTH